MVFKKGAIKRAGRKKGSVNKRTAESQAFVQDFLRNGRKGFLAAWKKLKEKDMVDSYIKVLEYDIPKKARIENENKMPTSITINMLPATTELIEQQNIIDITHEEIGEV